ncbi:hypothetical protein LCGC14_1888040 [marine sediment metagenome]|uniref:Uncharacterized protein n=1 Tax=marine sediment metagenome TaxID=412755 RepID=A0A0F9IYJ7_9ZZZZ
MSCGIICRIDPDGYSPYAELARIRRFVDGLPGVLKEPKPDQFERWLWILMGVVCVIFGVFILGILAYGVVSTIVAVV